MPSRAQGCQVASELEASRETQILLEPVSEVGACRISESGSCEALVSSVESMSHPLESTDHFSSLELAGMGRVSALAPGGSAG